MNDGEIRAQLLSDAEKAIDKVLAERPASDKITLRDIERLAVRAGAELSAGVQQALGAEGSQCQSGHFFTWIVPRGSSPITKTLTRSWSGWCARGFWCANLWSMRRCRAN